MQSWQIGKVKITKAVEMEMPIPYSPKTAFIAEATPEALQTMPWLYPHFVTEEGALKLSIHALLVEAPGLRLVVDTCVGNDKPRGLLGGTALATAFLGELEKAGWSRESVDAVVCTHLHVDHVGWNTMLVDGQWVPTFPNARYLLGREEFTHWSAVDEDENQAILGDSVKPIMDAGLVDLVEMDHVIGPEVRLRPTPGHTPGHVSVVIESEGQTALITGDMTHHPCQMGHPEWSPGFDSDPKAAATMRRSVFESVADSATLVIGTHYAGPTAGHVKRDAGAYRFEV